MPRNIDQVHRLFASPEKLNAETVASVNARLGFWIKIRAMNSGSPLKHRIVEYEWRCGCNAVASDGTILQKVSCVPHGGEDYESLD